MFEKGNKAMEATVSNTLTNNNNNNTITLIILSIYRMAALMLLWTLCCAHYSFAMMGYDCGSSASNLTTLSLLDVEECDIPIPELEMSKQYIQLLQLNEYSETQVIQCKIEISRIIYYCGMSSHVSIVSNGQIDYIEYVSHDACREMHRYGTTRVGQTIITGLRVNQTSTSSLTLAGNIKDNGECRGTSYSDPYGTWDNVVVQSSVRISLRSYSAQISLNSNKIHLRSGTICALLESSCEDSDGGYTFWSPRPRENCGLDRYGVLYSGLSDKIKEVESGVTRSIYSVTSIDVTFALASREVDQICGYKIISTEHPKLFIFETHQGNSFAIQGKTPVANLDIFAYVNSKFIYVERHIRQQMKSLYHDILVQQCNRERQILRNSLSLATQAPDEFAYTLMKGPGYMAVLAGEVVHIIKCIPVEVTLLRLSECYNQLPVTRGNETYFLTPRTHILSKKGTQTTCNLLLPPYYLFGDIWYKFTPIPVEAVAPATMKPMTKPTWRYTNPASLASNGIYTKDDLDKLREHIMFPVEKPAVLNNFVRGITGQKIVNQGEQFINLLDKSALEHLAETTWNHAWGRFIQFGTASAGLIGIILIIRGIKLIVDTIIHGYALHTVYGWSMFLLGAIWDSVTHLLLHLAKPPIQKSPPDVETGLETVNAQAAATANDQKQSVEKEASTQASRCEVYPDLHIHPVPAANLSFLP